LVLHDESTRPDFIEAVADVRDGLLDGLYDRLASPTGDGVLGPIEIEGVIRRAA
jgi:hypothetical protein